MVKHYKVTLSKTAQKQLDKLTDNIANPILCTCLKPKATGLYKIERPEGLQDTTRGLSNYLGYFRFCFNY